jgi:hypothetical protein
MPRKIRLMRFCKATELCTKLQIESTDRSASKAWRRNHLAVIVETNQPGIECGIPKSRQEKAIAHVEPLGVASALAPRDDV